MSAILTGRKITDPEWLIVMETFWSRFHNWTDERFMKAVAVHCETGKFFPAPAELIEAGRLHPVSDKPVQVKELLNYTPNHAEDEAARVEAMTAFRKFVESRG